MKRPSLVPISRSIMKQRYRTLSGRALDVPHPDDDASASIPAHRTHRILIVGNQYATSWGVRTHALALPGQLARQLAARSGYGADVEVISSAGLGIDDVARAIPGQDLTPYDSVVVITGVGDAFQLLPPLEWTSRLRGLLRALLAATPARTQVTVVGIQPVSSVSICRAKPGGVADRWAGALNEMSESVCGSSPRLHFLPTPIPLPTALDDVDAIRFRSPAVHEAWATTLARHLVPLLSEPGSAPETGDGVALPETERPSTDPDPVSRRLDALDTLGILHTPPEGRYTAIVRRARTLFATQGAAFSLITDRHQWNKAMVGFDRVELPIEESICALTIATAGAFVVEDAWADPRIAFDSRVRFYAGVPVLAPDGTPVGALCVFDAQPRDAGTIDTAFLHELALDIAGQLAEPALAVPCC
jgi:hypothetical protein